jgi:hypothetical protein
MSTGLVDKVARSLLDLVDTVRHLDEVIKDRWEGKRALPRHALAVPIRVREITEAGTGPAWDYLLRDVSESGIGFTSKFDFKPEQLLIVELYLNNASWRGRMRVRHSTQTIGGYKVGLVPDELPLHEESPPASAEEDRLDGQDWPGPRKLVTLDEAKAEINKATSAYRLARLTWGGLGRSARKEIRDVVAGLPPAPSDLTGTCRRKYLRRLTEDDVQVLVQTNAGGKVVRAEIIDVSEGGVGLELFLESLDGATEQSFAGQFKISDDASFVVGFGSRPNRVWVRATIVRCDEPKDGRVRIGIRF